MSVKEFSLRLPVTVTLRILPLWNSEENGFSLHIMVPFLKEQATVVLYVGKC